MMKFFIFCLLCSFACCISNTNKNEPRIFGHWFTGLTSGGLSSPCNGCPNRSCLKDKAVVLGYCCGCARVSDFLPINCASLDLNCPSDGRRLCQDYDYMLNCCCP